MAQKIERDDRLFVLHPGVWPGGWPLHGFMVRLMDASTSPAVPEDVVDWVKNNHDVLRFVTGAAPPARTESFLGFDFLWPDDVDQSALQSWFWLYRKEIKEFVYGDTALTYEELRRGGR